MSVARDGDGPVSFILEYAGMKLVIGGDTFPNKGFIEHAKGADLMVHESGEDPAQGLDTPS